MGTSIAVVVCTKYNVII